MKKPKQTKKPPTTTKIKIFESIALHLHLRGYGTSWITWEMSNEVGISVIVH